MKHNNIFTGMAIVGLTLTLTPVAGFAQQKSIKDQIVGNWSSVFWEQTYPDGRKEQPFGANPKGITIFEANGRFAAILLNPDLPKLESNNRVKPTPEEAMTIAKGVIAYYGTYTVNEAEKTLSFDMEGTSFVNQLSVPQKRLVTEITASELKFRNFSSPAGGTIEYVYKRVK